MKKAGIYIILLMLMAISVSAEVDHIGYYKPSENITLPQNCGTCTYVNFTKIINPDGSILVTNLATTKEGSFYSANIANATQTGSYLVNGEADVDGTVTSFAYRFEVNTEGNAFSNYYLIIFIFLFCYALLVMGIGYANYWIAAIGAMAVMVMGIYTGINGIGEINNLMTQAFGLINIGIGAYILVEGGIHAMNEA